MTAAGKGSGYDIYQDTNGGSYYALPKGGGEPVELQQPMSRQAY